MAYVRETKEAALKAKGAQDGLITRALVIMEGPMGNILAGNKTWEMRGARTTFRERVALIQSKSGHVVGVCDLVGCEGPLTMAQLMANVRRHRIPAEDLKRYGKPYRETYAWVVENAKRLRKPVPYKHPSGAVIWVKLAPKVARSVERNCG